MGVSAVIGASLIIGGTTTAINAHQQNIAAQKQADAMGDAQKAQQSMLNQQTTAYNQEQDKEKAATQQAFATAASNRKITAASTLPGAVPESNVGNPGNAGNAAKTLIGG